MVPIITTKRNPMRRFPQKQTLLDVTLPNAPYGCVIAIRTPLPPAIIQPTHLFCVYTKTKRVLGASQQPNVPLSWWFKTTRTLGRWRLLSGGGDVAVDGDDGAWRRHVNVVFTRSGKSYDPPINPNDQPNDSENPVNFDNDDEDEEPTPQLKFETPKPVKETPIPKPKIPYPQRLRKEKKEAQYGKFLDMIRVIQINVPLVEVLAGMPNYGKFLKELISNKQKLKQISSAFLSDESFAMIQNKVPPKLGDPKSFLIPINFSKTFSCNALADLGVEYLNTNR
ncbi:hypothetical protein Tco_1338005 [Tanacetum coccineum]